MGTGTTGLDWKMNGAFNAYIVGNGDTQLSTSLAASQYCMIDGIEGYWDGNASVTVKTESDGYWHVVIASDSNGNSGEVAAYMNCMDATMWP
jgi:hypothetical protein